VHGWISDGFIAHAKRRRTGENSDIDPKEFPLVRHFRQAIEISG
jgi:hypothetical protein